MKTYGLSDNPSQMEQGKISEAASVSLWVELGFYLLSALVRFLKFKWYGFMPAEDWPYTLILIVPTSFLTNHTLKVSVVT